MLLHHAVVDFLNCNYHVVRFCFFVFYSRINKSEIKRRKLYFTKVLKSSEAQARTRITSSNRVPSPPGVAGSPSSGQGPTHARGNGARRGPATHHRTANRPTRPAEARRSSAAWGSFGTRDLGAEVQGRPRSDSSILNPWPPKKEVK